MSDHTVKFTREAPEKRRQALIRATLSLIVEQGLEGTTVRAIAQRANVTQGLIRHYFSSKEDLITAAYEYHMSYMTNLTAVSDETDEASGKSRLSRFVVTGLKPPVVHPRSVSLWAGFLNKVRGDPQMLAIHKRTYHDFRGRLETLIAETLAEAGRATSPDQLRGLAIACNAVIDGLWMEGGALPDAFDPGELPRIGLASVGAIIGVNLGEEESLL